MFYVDLEDLKIFENKLKGFEGINKSDFLNRFQIFLGHITNILKNKSKRFEKIHVNFWGGGMGGRVKKLSKVISKISLKKCLHSIEKNCKWIQNF